MSRPGCNQHDASLLAIYDNQELRFVIEKLMTPLKLEHVFTEVNRPVSSPTK